MKTLAPTRAAYIAALVDGEGSIQLGRSVISGRREPTYHPRVCIYNTNHNILRLVQTETNLGALAPKKQQSTPARWKQCWHWYLRVEEILGFLDQVQPFLEIKAEQARLLREFLNLERFHLSQIGVSLEVSIERKLIWEDLRELNRRGI